MAEAEAIGTVEILEEIPEVDISDSVRDFAGQNGDYYICLLYTSPSPRDRTRSRMPSSA